MEFILIYYSNFLYNLSVLETLLWGYCEITRIKKKIYEKIIKKRFLYVLSKIEGMDELVASILSFNLNE